MYVDMNNLNTVLLNADTLGYGVENNNLSPIGKLIHTDVLNNIKRRQSFVDKGTQLYFEDSVRALCNHIKPIGLMLVTGEKLEYNTGLREINAKIIIGGYVATNTQGGLIFPLHRLVDLARPMNLAGKDRRVSIIIGPHDELISGLNVGGEGCFISASPPEYLVKKRSIEQLALYDQKLSYAIVLSDATFNMRAVLQDMSERCVHNTKCNILTSLSSRTIAGITLGWVRDIAANPTIRDILSDGTIISIIKHMDLNIGG